MVAAVGIKRDQWAPIQQPLHHHLSTLCCVFWIVTGVPGEIHTSTPLAYAEYVVPMIYPFHFLDSSFNSQVFICASCIYEICIRLHLKCVYTLCLFKGVAIPLKFQVLYCETISPSACVISSMNMSHHAKWHVGRIPYTSSVPQTISLINVDMHN